MICRNGQHSVVSQTKPIKLIEDPADLHIKGIQIGQVIPHPIINVATERLGLVKFNLHVSIEI